MHPVNEACAPVAYASVRADRAENASTSAAYLGWIQPPFTCPTHAY